MECSLLFLYVAKISCSFILCDSFENELPATDGIGGAGSRAPKRTVLSGGMDVIGGGGGAINGGKRLFCLEFPGKVIEAGVFLYRDSLAIEGKVMIGGGGGGCCGDLLRGFCDEDDDGTDGGFRCVCCF